MHSPINPNVNLNKAVPMANGHVSNYEDTPAFASFQNMHGKNRSFDDNYIGGGSSQALRGLQMNNTPLSLVYFSGKNIKKIQQMIRRRVFKDSRGAFRLDVDQDELDLITAMRYVFIFEAKNLPTDIKKQKEELNKKTIKYIVYDFGLMENIKQSYNYLREISQPLQIMPQPLNVNKTNKTLPSFTTLWR